ncbi:hypothetical protein ABFB09_06310 [Dehalogenimonas sp. THU2]|uniref:hypothetical protein n=1 Tax=Dehalogenimonas sp. THU2 TaxID=3151121 RepID=UPI003218A5A3
MITRQGEILLKPERDVAAGAQRIEVSVFTINARFNGYILCKPHQRLLDVLNSGSSLNTTLNRDFLEIRDVDIFDNRSSEPSRHLDIGYARRSNIIFIGEKQCIDSCRKELTHPMREKKPIRAEIKMPGVILKGAMYAETWQDLPGALHRDEIFLPLTDVELDLNTGDGENRFDFGAVNRDHIIFVGADL